MDSLGPGIPDVVAAQVRAEDAGLVVLGRLLLTGVGAGIMIGGLTTQFLFGWTGPYAGMGFLGATVGMFLGVVVQGLNATILQVARTVRPGLGLISMRAVLVPLPMITPFAVEWRLSEALSGMHVPSTLLAITLSAVTAWMIAPWCLAPLRDTDV